MYDFLRLVTEHDLGAAASHTHIPSLSRLQVASHVIFYPSQSYFIWRLTPVTTPYPRSVSFFPNLVGSFPLLSRRPSISSPSTIQLKSDER